MQIRSIYEQGGGKVYHQLGPKEISLVYSNNVRRERASGPDLWQMMRDPKIEEFYDRVVTTDA
eukprot:9056057-Lingulodinium_polyedra.AAC.1